MIRTNHFRAALGGAWLSACLLCCVALAASGQETPAQPPTADAPAVQGAVQQVPAEAAPGAGAAATSVLAGAHLAGPAPSKRQLHEAENAYLAGAKKLERDDLDAAEQQFERALKLDPENRNYAVAISVTRQHRLTELVQQSTKARLAGESQKAETLLAEARTIDPENPIVLEHSGPFVVAHAGRRRRVVLRRARRLGMQG